MKILADTKNKFISTKIEVSTLENYLSKCKTDSSLYLNTAERLLKGIGESEFL